MLTVIKLLLQMLNKNFSATAEKCRTVTEICPVTITWVPVGGNVTEFQCLLECSVHPEAVICLLVVEQCRVASFSVVFSVVVKFSSGCYDN